MQLVNESINISVPTYKQESSNVSYQIDVKARNKQSWSLNKRYSQFEDLHKKLILLFHDLPELPKKAFITFLIGKSKEQLEERRAGLERYLQQLIVRREIYHSDLLRDFLQLEQCESIIPPTLKHQSQLLMGIRDVAISDQGVMFILQADMNVLNRVEAYMNNTKMPWNSEEEEPKRIPVGQVECFVRQEDGEYNFKKLWTKEYDSQAICMYYEPITCVLLIGLDSGNINFLKISEKDSFQKYDQSVEIEIHVSRIMGLFYRIGQIHSVSKDCRYKVIDMENGGLKSDFKIGSHELTSLTFNEQRQISIVGNRNGQIYILNIKSPQPIVVLTVDTNSSFIRGLVLDYQKNYLISVSYNDGLIAILDIGQCLKDNQGKLKTKIQAKAKSRELQWSSKRGELFVGNDDGTVAIYNAVDLQPQFVLKAHEKAITKLIWDEQSQVLITGGKDELLKWWQFPKKWKAPDIEEEVKNKQIMEAKMDNILKLQSQNQKIDSDEEDETGLGTWHK